MNDIEYMRIYKEASELLARVDSLLVSALAAHLRHTEEF